MIPKRTWASLLIGLLVIQFSGCASIPGWKSTFKSSSSPMRSSIETQLDIARLHEHQGKLINAREIYFSILDNDPRNAQAFHRLGVVFTRMGNQDEAMSYYQRAVELNPESSEILCDFGYALFLNDDLETAEEALQQALAIDPNHKRSIGNLAMVQGHQGNFNKCLSLFREIVPEAKAYANLAYIHVQRGEGQLAIRRYGQALELDNKLESAAEALVQIAKLQNRVESHVPGLNNPPTPTSYVAADKNYESFATTGTTETRVNSPNTATQENREADSPIPGQWWNQSADFLLAGASSESIPEDEIAAEEFSAQELSVDESSFHQIASDDFSSERASFEEQSSHEESFNEYPVDEFVADKFVPAPHPLAETLQDDQFETEFDDPPGVVRIGSNAEASGDSDRF